MERKEYSKPYLVVEIFNPQEYIASCDNKSKISVKDHSGLYEGTSTKVPRVDLNDDRTYDSNENLTNKMGKPGTTMTKFSVEQHDVYMLNGTSNPSYNTPYSNNFTKVGCYWIVTNLWKPSAPNYYIYINESDIPYVKTTS